MTTHKKASPCANCPEVYEVEWPAALAFYCGAELPPGSRVLIDVQRLKHPRGTQNMITEGPLEGCPKGYADERREKREEASPAATGYEKARAMLERALREKEAV